METKANATTIILLAAMAVAPSLHAQNQPRPDSLKPGNAGSATTQASIPAKQPDSPGKPLQPGHHPKGHVKGPNPGALQLTEGLTALTSVSGTVGQLMANDDLLLDGFTLALNTGTMATVTFPTNLGQQVQKAVRPGDRVTAIGYTETAPTGETRFRMTSLTAGKTTIADTPRSTPVAIPATPTRQTITGKIASYKLDRKGHVRGFVIDDKTIVRIPPHVADQLGNLAVTGSTITVEGYPKALGEGQVQFEKTNILQASVLTISGQQYLVR